MNINQISGISEDEVKKFAESEIETTDQLWQAAYEYRDFTFQTFVDKLGVPASTVAALLAADACDETNPKSSWQLVNHWNSAKRFLHRRWGHWLDLALVIVPLVLIVTGVFSLPIKWRQTVVASRKISEGATITGEDVRRVWRIARPNALFTIEQVAGHKALRNIDRDEAVLAEMLAPSPFEQSQVVVTAPSGVAAFKMIKLEDVEIRRVPIESSTFTATHDVVGRYSLEPLPVGSTLHQNQLSGFRIAAADLENMSVLSIPIKEGYFSPKVGAGSRIDLLFAPRDQALTPPAAIEDVLILNLDHSADVWTIVVAIRPGDKPTLLKWLALADVVASPSSTH